MKDSAKAIAHKGQRDCKDEGRPQHRRKGGGRERANSTRRMQDKSEVRDDGDYDPFKSDVKWTRVGAVKYPAPFNPECFALIGGAKP